MVEFAPLLMILIVWVFIGVPAVLAKKAAEQKKQMTRALRQPQAAETETKTAGEIRDAAPERLTTLRPSITFSDRDDSVYQGSMNAFTGEGYDPCHDEQMLPMTQIESEPAAQPQQAQSGLPLGWTGNDVVRGIVMSEILNRKQR